MRGKIFKPLWVGDDAMMVASIKQKREVKRQVFIAEAISRRVNSQKCWYRRQCFAWDDPGIDVYEICVDSITRNGLPVMSEASNISMASPWMKSATVLLIEKVLFFTPPPTTAHCS
jgi:hypothetical protein